ncbi:Lycopene epsilon cyclase, chloroplastic [Glycine max]|nr:Lycopene epsilon cyclase, chloroplastic [Glycine max]
MECVAARNLAAMAFCVSPSSSRLRLRRKKLWRRRAASSSSSCGGGRGVRWLKVEAKAGSESCVATKEDFADEEDYVKAGGSELVFVQMQQKKAMEMQSKLADKLPPIGDDILDLVVIGCGPAGLALAAESAKLGLKVGLIGPDLPFTNNYGVWEDEFKDLGLEGCIEHVWKDTIVFLDNKDPIFIGRSYGRASRHLLHEELLRRCVESGVSYLSSRVESIIEATNGHSHVVCEYDIVVPSRLVTVASGAASGKLLQYEVGGPKVSVQTAYGVEVERLHEAKCSMSRSKFSNISLCNAHVPYKSETCLASKDAMPFDLLKKKLFSRLNTMGIRITKTYEEEWSYIPVGGSLPNTEQKNLAFGYSVVRSLSEAPKYASVIATILKDGHAKDIITQERRKENLSMQAWNTLWPQERKRQRAFFLFGLALILQLDIEGIRTFFRTFFCLPDWMWQGFLGSSLSSTDLVLFAFYMFIIAPNNLRMGLVRHLLSDPTGATMIKTYLTI